MNEHPSSVNASGAPTGPNGHVLCRTCGVEVTGISRETRLEYALCLSHRRQHKEDDMPRAPKPSEKKREKKRAAKPNGKAKANGHAGHFGDILAKARDAGGMTGDEIRAECKRRKLSEKTGGNYVCYLRKAGVVKEAAQ